MSESSEMTTSTAPFIDRYASCIVVLCMHGGQSDVREKSSQLPSTCDGDWPPIDTDIDRDACTHLRVCLVGRHQVAHAGRAERLFVSSGDGGGGGGVGRLGQSVGRSVGRGGTSGEAGGLGRAEPWVNHSCNRSRHRAYLPTHLPS